MTWHRLLLKFRISRSLLLLLAILLAATIVFISIWLWFDYRMNRLEEQQEKPNFKENPNF